MMNHKAITYLFIALGFIIYYYKLLNEPNYTEYLYTEFKYFHIYVTVAADERMQRKTMLDFNISSTVTFFRCRC